MLSCTALVFPISASFCIAEHRLDLYSLAYLHWIQLHLSFCVLLMVFVTLRMVFLYVNVCLFVHLYMYIENCCVLFDTICTWVFLSAKLSNFSYRYGFSECFTFHRQCPLHPLQLDLNSFLNISFFSASFIAVMLILDSRDLWYVGGCTLLMTSAWSVLQSVLPNARSILTALRRWPWVVFRSCTCTEATNYVLLFFPWK